MHCNLDGRVALVTGAAGAIGSAIARRLADNGARLVIADINLPGAEAMAATLARFGQLDILVNNAGVNTLAHRVNIDQFPPEEWERITSIDLDGLFLMSRRALQPMLAGGRGGRIVNIASVVGLAAMRLQSPFVAAKAGIIHLTRSMALELGPQGISTNAVAPGSIMTELTKQLFYGADGQFAGRTEEFMRHIPLGRPGTTDEIAEAVLFLSSPAAAYINGQVLAVDGGWTAGFTI